MLFAVANELSLDLRGWTRPRPARIAVAIPSKPLRPRLNGSICSGFTDFAMSDSINISTIVASRNLAPQVVLTWGENSGHLTPQEARDHAIGLLQASISIEMEAATVRLAIDKLGMSREEAGGLLQIIRQRFQKGEIPSCTINMGEDHIRPDTAREHAMFLLLNAYGVELEAVLAAFFAQDLNLDAGRVSAILENLRSARGMTSVFPNSGVDQ